MLNKADFTREQRGELHGMTFTVRALGPHTDKNSSEFIKIDGSSVRTVSTITKTKTFFYAITRNDHPFGCPIICTDIYLQCSLLALAEITHI